MLRKVKVKCDNSKIDQDELKAYIKQTPNRRLLRFLPFHLMIYNIVNPEKEALRKEKRSEKLEEINTKRRWKGKEPKDKFYFTEWLQGIGEEPVIYEDYLTKKTSRQFAMFLRNKGYYEPIIKDTVEFKRKRAYVTYTIKTNKAYHYRKIDILIDDPKLEEYVLKDTANSVLKENAYFDVDKLQNERERITNMLKRNGYFFFAKEYIDYQVDTALNTHKVDVVMRIKNKHANNADTSLIHHKKYELKNIYIFLDFDPKLAIKGKEDYYKDFDTLFYQDYYFIYKGKIPIKPDIIIRSLSLKKGDLYNIKNVGNSYRNLASLRVFKLTNIQFSEPDTIRSENGVNYLDCTIQLTPFTKQSYITEIEGTNSSGNLGVAGNIAYQHKSLFKGAELFELKFKGGFQAQTRIVESTDGQEDNEHLPFNTFEVGPEMSLRIPKLLLPFRFGKFSRDYNPKTTFLSAYNYQKRPEYTRTILTGKLGFSWNNTRNLTHIITPIELNSIKLADMTSEFKEQIDTSFFKNSYLNQLIASSNYSFIFSNQDIKKIKSFSYLKTSIEIAGNVLALGNRIAGNTDTLKAGHIFGVKYAQYAKLDLEYSYHKFFNPENRIVCRGFIGIGIPYGNSEAMPFVKQYFAGGANSIRAWQVRSLGPGSYVDNSTIKNLTSDLRLEANVEYRFDIISMLEGALFVDVGNIWSINENDDREDARFEFNRFYKELAVGIGAGIRLDFDFFIFRLDFGYKVVDPAMPEGSRLVLGREPFNNSEYAFAVGIGYPF